MGERNLRLQPRLQCIADCVPQHAVLMDVGTDHAYLPVWLLLNGRIEHAIASDINAGPLEHARRTAELYGVSEQMEFRLCDGLEGATAEDADIVVLAGMGGETIISVLRTADWLLKSNITLHLQPMTKPEQLRRWLTENGFSISSERLVRDKGTIYAVLEVRAGASTPLTGAEAWCGKDLLRDPLYGEYAADRVRKLEYAAQGIRRGKQADEPLAQALETDAASLREMIKEWKNADRRGIGTRDF